MAYFRSLIILMITLNELNIQQCLFFVKYSEGNSKNCVVNTVISFFDMVDMTYIPTAYFVVKFTQAKPPDFMCVILS